MAEPIYRVEELRRRVLELLRRQPFGMKAGPIAVALDLPKWAVFAALDSAVLEGLVAYDPQDGYSAVRGEVVPKPVVTDWSAA